MKIKNLLTILMLSGVGITSCKKNQLPSDSGNSNLSMVSEEKQHLSKLEFGQALAVSLKNKELRDMIKSEALKQFDNDYDVLFANIMDRKLSSGETVIEFIASKSGNSNEFIKNTGDLPLLNIFVPELETFSADKWNTDSQIPTVAVLREKDKRDGIKELKAFDENSKEIKLNYNIIPTIPIVVIKNNERVEVSGSASSQKLAIAKTESVSNSQLGLSNKYSFTSPAFDKSQNPNLQKSAAQSKSVAVNSDRSNPGGAIGDERGTDDRSGGSNVDGSAVIVDAGTKYAYENKLQSQRDYLYYGIDSTKNITSGQLKRNYSEHIVSIEMENDAALKKITDDWTEGNLEIVITVLRMARNGSIESSLRKVISCGVKDLKSDTPIPNRLGTVRDPYLLEYNKFTPLELGTWDVEKYGDTWKFVASEFDNGEVTTTTQTVTSEFSTNFKESAAFEIPGIVKIGAEGGGSSTDTKTTTTVIMSTNTSDDLYEGILNFYKPVYLRLVTAGPGGRAGTGPITSAIPYTINTGFIRIKVQPIKTI